MANLIPSIQEINNFRPQLTEGERTLMNALQNALDDTWTIYIQPHLNGLSPDIIIFSKNYGLGVFEVKDWNLNVHRINKHNDYKYNWQVYNNQKWETKNITDCPFKQVSKYKDSIIDYEIPILRSKNILLGNYIYGVIKTFVYFHKHNSNEITNLLPEIDGIKSSYIKWFGNDKIQANILSDYLQTNIINPGQKFGSFLKADDVSARIENALAYPQHGNIGLEHLNKPLSKKQEALLSNINPPKSSGKRVSGVAGSGKTLVLIHKAVNAAIEGKQVLIVCYNITMANYLKDCTNRLARSKDLNCHRNIQVFHFHYLFDKEKGLNKEKLNSDIKPDVILIDEAQDFKSNWIQQLQDIGSENYHLMIFEDDRQNIYGVDVKERESVPGIIGRPNKLQSSYRISPQTARLANMFATYYCPDSLSSDVEKTKENDLFVSNVWYDGFNPLDTLKQDVHRMIHSSKSARPDIAILVCTIKSGWEVCQALDELNLPYQKTFESECENLKLQELYKNQSQDNFKREEIRLRRGYKVGFWMQTGKIKVSTIHSFKGWELSNILVYFKPSIGQQIDNAVAPLLYTAMTRSQQNLTIYGADYDRFVDMAVQESCVARHPSSSKTNSLVPIF